MKKYLLILVIGLFAFCPDIPNTTTFRFSQVTMAVYGDSASGRNLTSAFADATGTFDPAYVGSKTNLLNFRNYQAVCTRPGGLTTLGIYNNVVTPTAYTLTAGNICNAIATATSLTGISTMSLFTEGATVYSRVNGDTDCTLAPDGYYIVFISGTAYGMYIVSGILHFYYC
jgi:hypothetical protein